MDGKWGDMFSFHILQVVKPASLQSIPGQEDIIDTARTTDQTYGG